MVMDAELEVSGDWMEGRLGTRYMSALIARSAEGSMQDYWCSAKV